MRNADADILLEGREQEEHRFQALASDGEERHADQGPPAGIASPVARVDRVVQLRLDRAGSLLHPEDHRGQDHDRHKRDEPFEELLLLLRKFRAGKVEHEADARQRPTASPTPSQTDGMNRSRPVCFR